MRSMLCCILVLGLFVSSCATIMQGTTQEIGFTSSPSGAKVYLNGVILGETPLVADVKRKSSGIIKIELEGYEPYETTITKKTSGWVWGNIIFGGLPGLAVDAITGGIYCLTPEQVNTELRNKNSEVTISDDQLYIFVELLVNEEWKNVGYLVRSNQDIE